jgi:hypothetical protein
MGFVSKILILGTVYYLLKFHFKLDEKLLLVTKDNWKACIFSGFDPGQCYSIQTDEDTIVLSEEDRYKVIKSYLKKDGNIKIHPECAIGVGYNVCTDINFKAVDLFKILQPSIEKLEQDEG